MYTFTSIKFTETVEMDDTIIPAGTTAFVTLDFGFSNIQIDGKGKVIDVKHHWPFNGKQAREYEIELLNFTGVMETNIGGLLFKNGQLVHLDMACIVAHLPVVINVKIDSEFRLYGSVSDEEFDDIAKQIEIFKNALDVDNNQLNDHTRLLKTTYKNRDTVLVSILP